MKAWKLSLALWLALALSLVLCQIVLLATQNTALFIVR